MKNIITLPGDIKFNYQEENKFGQSYYDIEFSMWSTDSMLSEESLSEIDTSTPSVDDVDVSFANTTKELADILSISAHARAELFGKKFDGGGNYLNETKLETNSFVIVINAGFVTQIDSLKNVDLSGEAANDLETNPGIFLDNFGTHCITKQHWGGRLYLFYKLTITNLSQMSSIEASIKTKFGKPKSLVQLSTSIKRLTESTEEGFSWEQKVIKIGGGGDLPVWSAHDASQIIGYVNEFADKVKNDPAVTDVTVTPVWNIDRKWGKILFDDVLQPGWSNLLDISDGSLSTSIEQYLDCERNAEYMLEHQESDYDQRQIDQINAVKDSADSDRRAVIAHWTKASDPSDILNISQLKDNGNVAHTPAEYQKQLNDIEKDPENRQLKNRETVYFKWPKGMRPTYRDGCYVGSSEHVDLYGWSLTQSSSKIGLTLILHDNESSGRKIMSGDVLHIRNNEAKVREAKGGICYARRRGNYFRLYWWKANAEQRKGWTGYQFRIERKRDKYPPDEPIHYGEPVTLTSLYKDQKIGPGQDVEKFYCDKESGGSDAPEKKDPDDQDSPPKEPNESTKVATTECYFEPVIYF